MPYRPTLKNSDGSVTDLPLEAETAVKLKTARTIGLSGVTATAKSFNGTGNITIPVTAVPASLITGDVHAKTAEKAVYDTNTGTYSQLQINSSGHLMDGVKIISSKQPLYVGTIGTASTDYTILSGDTFPTPGQRYEVVYMDNNCKKSFEIVFPAKSQYSYVYLCFSLMFGATTSDYDQKIKTSSTETYKYIYWKIDHTNQKVMQTKYAAGSCAATTAYFKGIYIVDEPMGA